MHFEVDDLEKEWTYKPDYFDFIHSRDVAMAIKDWGRYISQIYKHAAPGATVEIAENCLEKFFCDDGTYPEDSALNKWSAAFCPSVAKMGAHPYNTSADYKRWLEEAGFINIQVHEFKIPLGTYFASTRVHPCFDVHSRKSSSFHCFCL